MFGLIISYYNFALFRHGISGVFCMKIFKSDSVNIENALLNLYNANYIE